MAVFAVSWNFSVDSGESTVLTRRAGECQWSSANEGPITLWGGEGRSGRVA